MDVHRTFEQVAEATDVDVHRTFEQVAEATDVDVHRTFEQEPRRRTWTSIVRLNKSRTLVLPRGFRRLRGRWSRRSRLKHCCLVVPGREFRSELAGYASPFAMNSRSC